MIGAHAAAADPAPFHLPYAVRSPEDVFFRGELTTVIGREGRRTAAGPMTVPRDRNPVSETR